MRLVLCYMSSNLLGIFLSSFQLETSMTLFWILRKFYLSIAYLFAVWFFGSTSWQSLWSSSPTGSPWIRRHSHSRWIVIHKAEMHSMTLKCSLLHHGFFVAICDTYWLPLTKPQKSAHFPVTRCMNYDLQQLNMDSHTALQDAEKLECYTSGPTSRFTTKPCAEVAT